MQRYPEVELELTSDLKFTDIVAGRFDAGIRLGQDVEQDMISLKVSEEMKMCLVASPQYFAQKEPPKTLDDLKQHQCICVRMPRLEGVQVWEFRSPITKDLIKFTPKGRFIVNNNVLTVKGALSHLGIAWIPKERVAEQLEKGELVEVLKEWAISYEGYHLYYPNRRQHLPLFKALVECLKM